MDNKQIQDFKSKGYFIAYLDGAKCQTKSTFLSEIGLAFKFPGYYGQNFYALEGAINKLDWLKQKNYVLDIKNSDFLLREENEKIKKFVERIFSQTIQHWQSVPNADFVIIKSPYNAIRNRFLAVVLLFGISILGTVCTYFEWKSKGKFIPFKIWVFFCLGLFASYLIIFSILFLIGWIRNKRKKISN